ncbi:MAG: ATP-binding protein, partial [Kiritimatiellia bacterium]
MAKERLDPNPSSFVHSLRSVGYSLETAVADIIDNSITAGATNIQIFFNDNGASPVFAIIDNGAGMSASELKEAMRLGSTSPLEKRREFDLGRFGLGMKTASFSICKRLTTISATGGKTSAARWDLDDIAKHNKWEIEILQEKEIKTIPFIEHLSDNGTAIVWEKIDRIIDDSAKNQQKEMDSKIAVLEKHLRLTFHRFIDGERGISKVTISINGHQLQSFDPFNVKN